MTDADLSAGETPATTSTASGANVAEPGEVETQGREAVEGSAASDSAVDSPNTESPGGASGVGYSAGIRQPDYSRAMAARPNRPAKTGERAAQQNGARNGARNGTATRAGARPGSGTRLLKANNKVDERRERLLKVVRNVLYAVVVLAAAGYVLMAAGFLNTTADPQDALSALKEIKNIRSSQDGLTIDQWVSQDLSDAKKAGTVTKYQGWSTTPIPGDSSKVIVAFRYETKAGKRSAEWVADLKKHTYSAMSDLARKIYAGTPAQ